MAQLRRSNFSSFKNHHPLVFVVTFTAKDSLRLVVACARAWGGHCCERCGRSEEGADVVDERVVESEDTEGPEQAGRQRRNARHGRAAQVQLLEATASPDREREGIK